MKLEELMSLGGNLSVSVSLKELRAWHDELVNSTGNNRQPDKPPVQEELLTRREVLKMLGIDSSTLWRWAKTGYLVPFNFGGQKRYKASDILELVEGKKKGSNR